MSRSFSRLRNSLDDIAERLTAGLSSIRRHDAEGDAILLAQVFQRIQNHPNLDKLCANIPIHEAQLPKISVPSKTVEEKAPASQASIKA